MGQGQPRVIIWTTLLVLPYTMLHTKFQGHWSIGSGVEDFLRFLPYMGMAAMLVMWPRSFEQLFFPKGPGGCIWNLVAIDPAVSEEKLFEIVDGRTTDDGWTTEPSHPISSPGAFGSGELKMLFTITVLGYLHQQGAWSDSKLITELKRFFAEYYVASAILYREVPHMLHAKYQQTGQMVLEKKSLEWAWQQTWISYRGPFS